MKMADFLFWIFFIPLFYTYIGYPILLKVISFFYHRDITKAEINPKVTLIISAYDEETSIRKKIENSLNLEYDKNKLEIIIASDSSTDKTDEIVREYILQGIKLVRLEERGGKTAVQNYAVSKTDADSKILLFSDATTIYDSKVIKKIVANFADATVGAVEGKLIYVRTQSSFGGEKSTARSYDQLVKLLESKIYSIIGDNGCLYAVRKELYTPLRPDLTSDFALPLEVIKKGYRVIYEPQAICFEEVSLDIRSEFKRKIRTVRAGFKVFFNAFLRINPFKRPFLFMELISHKFSRWLSPYLMLLVFICNIFLFKNSLFYLFIFGLQFIFYASALIGFFVERIEHKLKLFTIPFNFCLVNTAAVVGLLEFIFGENTEIWSPIRKVKDYRSAEEYSKI